MENSRKSVLCVCWNAVKNMFYLCVGIQARTCSMYVLECGEEHVLCVCWNAEKNMFYVCVGMQGRTCSMCVLECR